MFWCVCLSVFCLCQKISIIIYRLQGIIISIQKDPREKNLRKIPRIIVWKDINSPHKENLIEAGGEGTN